MAPERQASPLNLPSPPRRRDFTLQPFTQSSNARAAWQLLSTLAPVAGLWGLVAWIGQAELAPLRFVAALLPVLALLVLFSARTFSQIGRAHV